MAHKNISLSELELDFVLEYRKGLDPANIEVHKKLEDWIKRSENIVARNERFKLGNLFQDNFSLGLRNNVEGISSPEYLAVKYAIPDIESRVIIEGAKLCINGKSICNKAGEYFIPDFIAVKKVKDLITGAEYLDIEILDTKLLFNTKYTPNQVEAQKIKEYFIKSIPQNAIIQDGNLKMNDLINKVVIRENNFKKVFSDGNGNFNGGGIN